MFRVTWTTPTVTDEQNPIEKTIVEARMRRDDRWQLLFEVFAPQEFIDVRNPGIEELRLTHVDSHGVPSEPEIVAVRERRTPPSKPRNVTVSVVQ